MAASILKPMPADLWISSPMAWLLAFAAVLALAAIGALAGLFAALRRRRPLRSLWRLAGFLVLALAALAASLLAVSLHGYARLTDEVPVATIRFSQTGARSFSAELDLADGRRMVLPVHGDEWQLDARVLKWSSGGPAGLTRCTAWTASRPLAEIDQKSTPGAASTTSPAAGR